MDFRVQMDHQRAEKAEVEKGGNRRHCAQVQKSNDQREDCNSFSFS